MVRTLISVKYLDGVEYLIHKISRMSEECGLNCQFIFEAREEGYYAGHLYFTQTINIPGIEWDTIKINAIIELQITTQLQEVIRKLLHKYYEQRRIQLKSESQKWQWNYNDDEFIANYLGHILHYVEGMIMEIREKQKEMVI
jgi:hypothetical protein